MATFRAGMVPPANTKDGETAPGPLTEKQRMAPMRIGGKLKPGDRRMLEPVLDPVEGEEVGMEEKKAKVYKKKFASGGYTKAADGCVQRGKTRGKMV